ncbi:MAG: hypothetical protein JW797_09685 [Bradymonadales bacterium]|nr:hypothetical protein [Bradymonadales bacterium]
MKIQIGDIQIIADQGLTRPPVRRPADRLAERRPRSPHKAEERNPIVDFFEAHRITPPLLVGVGSLGACCLLAVLVLAGGGIPFYLLFLLVIALSTSLGLIGIGHLMRRTTRTRQRDQTVRREGLLLARMERLRPYLANRDDTHTVEWFVHQTGMTEEAVVLALKEMVERGEVEEDLDLDSGEWFYYSADQEIEKATLPLSERVKAIKGA